MRHFSGLAAAAAALLGLGACSGTGQRAPNLAVFRYQHVANAHQVWFANPVVPVRGAEAVGFVAPRESPGFWAIFVLCSLNVTGNRLGRFHYDASRFEVEYDGRSFGPPQPYSLRLQGTAELNTPAATPAIASAIAAEIDEGPRAQVFGRGYYPDLNYRVAVYLPKELPDYAGEQLALRYAGEPAILIGNGHPPSDIPAVGGNGAGIAARCLP
jgi:hypothetical protein